MGGHSGSSWFVIFCLCICVFSIVILLLYNGVNGQVVLIANRLASDVAHEVFVVFAIFHFQEFDLLAAVEALCILLIMIFCIFKSTAKH